MMNLCSYAPTAPTSQVRKRPSRRRVPCRLLLEPLEDRCLPSGFRPIDEVGNNHDHPLEGTAGRRLRRVSPVAYADGISAPS
jgi:hypothetical protein